MASARYGSSLGSWTGCAPCAALARATATRDPEAGEGLTGTGRQSLREARLTALDRPAAVAYLGESEPHAQPILSAGGQDQLSDDLSLSGGQQVRLDVVERPTARPAPGYRRVRPREARLTASPDPVA
jgi:hypothetical protein